MKNMEMEKEVRFHLFLLGVFGGFLLGVILTLSVVRIIVTVENRKTSQLPETEQQIELIQTEVDSPAAIEVNAKWCGQLCRKR